MKKNVIMKASAFFMSAIALTIGFASCNNNGNNGEDDPINPGDVKELVLDQTSVTVNEGLTVTVAIVQGNGGYTVKSANEEVAVAEVSGTTVTI